MDKNEGNKSRSLEEENDLSFSENDDDSFDEIDEDDVSVDLEDELLDNEDSESSNYEETDSQNNSQISEKSENENNQQLQLNYDGIKSEKESNDGNTNQSELSETENDNLDKEKNESEISSEDENNPEKDFPEYANEINKDLNKNILKIKKDNKKIDANIEDYKERYIIMKDHFENIKQEIKNTQILSDSKSQEIESEKHYTLILERQIGKLLKDQNKKENNINELREKLNELQQKIFEGNQKLEKLKLEINWNQEEKEMWLLAVKQKEEDKLIVEKYKRADDLKIKELTIDIERLTTEKNKIENNLEGEVTETQALQIEIDKISDEFKIQNIERERLYEQWDGIIKKIADKNKILVEKGNKIIKCKNKIEKFILEIDEKKKNIRRVKRSSNYFENDIKKFEKIIFMKKNDNKTLLIQERSLKADMKITQNRLSAYSSKFEKNKKIIVILQNELIKKQKRLSLVENNYKKQIKILDIEKKNDLNLLLVTKNFEDESKKKVKEQSELERKIELKKEDLYHIQKKLYKLKESESSIITEIGSITSNIKNLTTYTNKLHSEIQKQQELLYNAEYQIQLLERKVARAHGEKSVEETDFLVEKIKIAKEAHSKAQQKYIATVLATKQLADEHRALEKKLKNLEEEEKKYIILIEKVNLENDMTTQDLNTIAKKKEDILVANNIMKLEIKKIQNKVLKSHNNSLQIENKKNQLDLSMSEKEKEIQVHHSILKAEHKNSELERQKVAVELAKRKKKNLNLQIKYKSLIQSKQGDVNVSEHSQAYYVIKAAQEKEELERKQDELMAKINKADSSLKALNNTLIHLKARNSTFREYHLNKNATKKDLTLKKNLEDQFNDIGDVLIERRKEVSKIREEIEDKKMSLNESEQKLEYLLNKIEDLKIEAEKFRKDQDDKEKKMARAKKYLTRNLKLSKKKKLKFENCKEYYNYQMLLQENVTKTMQSLLKTIGENHGEIFENIKSIFIENDLEVKSLVSSINIGSQYSKSLKSSKFGIDSKFDFK